MKKKTFSHLALAALPLAMLLPGKATRHQKLPFTGVNYAHRGLHTQDRSVPENSLKAFRLACEAGYGIELDVHLTKDGKLVVFHDDTLERVCGVKGNLQDFTAAQLMQIPLYGTKEHIPSFAAVLTLLEELHCPALIVELKTGKRNRELCRKVYAALQEYRGNVCIESFNPFIVAWFKRHGKDLLRGQLAMPAEHYPKSQPRVLSHLVANGFLNFLGRPQFSAYRIGPEPLSLKLCHRMGQLRIGWTSHKKGDEKGRDGVIFEFYRPAPRFR